MGDKPLYRVGVAGLDPRDVRLIEIVFRHSQYNRYEFRLADVARGEPFDLLIANALDPAGQQAGTAARERGVPAPVIEALPRGAPSSARHAISIDRLTLQLLPILNRVVELELRGEAAAGAARGPQPARPADVAADRTQQAPGSAPPSAPALPGGRESAAGTAPAMQVQPPIVAAQPTRSAPARAPESADAAWQAAATAPHAGAAAERSRPATGTAGGAVAQPAAAVPAPGAPKGAAAPSTSGAREPAGSERPRPMPAEPAAPRSNLVPFPAASVADAQAAPRLRVLVVDDSPTVRRQLTVAFDRLGLGCETVASAAQALERLAREHFDLALVDVVMPDADGYKLTREIKRDKRLRQMPVIILTSRSSPFDLARGALAGCDAYLSKPVPFRALEAAVVKQLRKSLAIDDLTGYMRTTTGTTPGSGGGRTESRLGRFFRR